MELCELFKTCPKCGATMFASDTYCRTCDPPKRKPRSWITPLFILAFGITCALAQTSAEHAQDTYSLPVSPIKTHIRFKIVSNRLQVFNLPSSVLSASCKPGMRLYDVLLTWGMPYTYKSEGKTRLSLYYRCKDSTAKLTFERERLLRR